MAGWSDYAAARCTREPYRHAATMPKTAKVVEVKAAFKNGVLTVHLPKAEESKPRQVDIA